MSKPIPGQSYIVQTGDTLERIAAIAYGDPSKSADIARANQITIVAAGVILLLPAEFGAEVQVVHDGLVLVIGSLEIITESVRFFESQETVANSWTAVVAWQPDQKPDFDKLIRPYSYAPSQIFLNKQLLATGRVYGVTPSLNNRQELAIECWSKTADFMDSTLQPPYEESAVTLKQRAETLAKPFAIDVEFNLSEDGQFDRVTAEEEQTAGAHLLQLAKQRGALVSSTAEGNLTISLPDLDAAPVATIEEGQQGFSGFTASFDGRARFSEYRVIGDSPIDGILAATIKDPGVSVTRFRTRTVTDVTPGNINQAADWEKRRFLAGALTIPITAEGFLNANGERWSKGQKVTLISPTLFIKNGFDMLIKSVEFTDDKNGEKSQLTLVPPTVYGTGDIVEPWL